MVALVKTPLQLICAMEYLHYKQIDPVDVQFIYIRKYDFSDAQMAKTFDFFKITKYKTWNFKNANVINLFGKKIFLNKFPALKLIYKLNQIINNSFNEQRLKQFLKKSSVLILGDPNLKLFSNLLPSWQKKKLVLLEDGLNSTIETNYNINENFVESFSFLRTKAPIKNIHSVIENEFILLKKQKRGIDKNKIFFIGQPLLEGKLVNEVEIAGFFKHIGKMYQNESIVYFPHRWEFNIDKYNLPINIRIESKQDYPIEVLIYMMEMLPAKIISFYSAALVTLKKTLPDEVNFTAIDFAFSNRHERVKAAYKLFEKYDIPILNINPSSY